MVLVRRTKALALGSAWVGLMASCSPSCPDRGPVEVDASAGQIVCAGQTVTLHGTALGEPDAEMLVFEWEQTAGPEASLDNPSSAGPSFVATTAGVYDFRLTITTGDDCATGDDAVRLVVLEPNDCGACATGGCCLDEHCDDGDSCTVDSCPAGSCRYEVAQTTCGDGECDECAETCENCSRDCGACGTCGNAFCDVGEDCFTCSEDCAGAACCSEADCDDDDSCTRDECVDGVCSHSTMDPCCGDGACDAGEDCANCEDDCGECACEPCGSDGDCNDGLFCSGQETCGEDGCCDSGQAPCPVSCAEAADACADVPPPAGCTSDANCSDGDACTTNACVSGTCQSSGVQCSAGQTCDPGTGQCITEGTIVRAYDSCFATPVNTALTINLRANADPYVETLTFDIVSPPTNGALSGTPPTMTYTPQAGFVGADTFSFQASDGEKDSNSAMVTVFVGTGEPECTGYYQCIAGEITSGGDTDSFTFDGAAAEQITAYLDHVGTMSLRVSPPTASGASDWFEDSSPIDRQIDNVTLPAGGEYTITVDGSDDATAEYFLCVLRQDQPVVPIGYEECEQRGIEVQGDQDSFSFFGSTGEQITVFLSHDAVMSLRLTPPAGAGAEWFEDFSGSERLIDEVTLPATGEYTITVDGYLDYTGDYQLCLDRLQ